MAKKKPKKPRIQKLPTDPKGRRCFRAIGNPLFAYSEARAIQEILLPVGAAGIGIPSLLKIAREKLLELKEKVTERFKGIGADVDPAVPILCKRNGLAFRKNLNEALLAIEGERIVEAQNWMNKATFEAQKCAGTALEFCCVPLKPGRLKELRELARKKK